MFLSVNLALLKPMKSFPRRGCVVQATKNKKKSCSFLDGVGRRSCNRSADWLKIDVNMWKNPSFDLSGSRQLVGTLRCALSLFSDLHFDSRTSLAFLSSACISLGILPKAKFTPAVSSVQSLTPPPPPSLSLSPREKIRDKESLPLNTTIRTSKRKFAKSGNQVQVSWAHSASMQWLIQKKNCTGFFLGCRAVFLS